MKPAEIKFNYNDGKGFDAAQRYAEKLFEHGFKFCCYKPNGGKVYIHHDLNLEVLVYVA